MLFTKQQREAIECHDENLQIIACAGSGKTQVISQRIIRLLTSGEAKPEQIGNQLGLADMYIGTIHAWCLDILQDSCLEYQKFDVLD
jgi:DNA helicase-2/ATP-dependent DNA helicase PcrA